MSTTPTIEDYWFAILALMEQCDESRMAEIVVHRELEHGILNPDTPSKVVADYLDLFPDRKDREAARKRIARLKNGAKTRHPAIKRKVVQDCHSYVGAYGTLPELKWLTEGHKAGSSYYQTAWNVLQEVEDVAMNHAKSGRSV